MDGLSESRQSKRCISTSGVVGVSGHGVALVHTSVVGRFGSGTKQVIHAGMHDLMIPKTEGGTE